VRVAYVKIFWALEICQLALKKEIILASAVFTQLAWKFLFVFFHLQANPRLWFFAYVVVVPKNLFPLSTK
jgi:hypothetical protein